MSRTESREKPIGLWAMIAIALILSISSIVLQVSKLLDHRTNDMRRGTFEYDQLLMTNQQLRNDLAGLRAQIAESTNFQNLRQTMRQGVAATTTEDAPPSLPPADSPLAAVLILEKSQSRRNFDEFQQITPRPQRRILEELYLVNRELRWAYQELAGLLTVQMPEVELPDEMNETDQDRLRRLVFIQSPRYDILKTNKNKDTEADLDANYRVNQRLPGTEDTQQVTRPIKLKAVQEGVAWKVADPDMSQRLVKVLGQLRLRTASIKSMVQDIKDNKIKSEDDLDKSWKALSRLE